MNANICTSQLIVHIQETPATIHVNKVVKTLLIVDDSALVVKNLIEMLEETEGIHSIESCGTYTEAIDMISICSPVVVLLDINLPDKSGIVLLKYIKTFYPQIKVVMVTNEVGNFYKNLCFHMGADYFLDKSNDFEKLPALIASIIQ